jgi:spore germination protein KC
MYEFISKISSDSAAGVPEISLVGSEPEKLDSSYMDIAG